MSWNVSSQTNYDCNCYDRLINLSSYYEAKRDYKEAVNVYELGLEYKEKEKWVNYEYYKLGDLYNLIGDQEKAVAYFGEALKMGYDIEYMEYEKYDALKLTNEWKGMVSNLDSLKRDYQKNINLDYRLGLEDIRGSDQTIRRLIQVPDSTFAKLDSINFSRVKKLIEKYGYPNIKKDGFDGGQNVILVLLHASMYSESDYEQIIEILNSAIIDFSFKKSFLAQFIDRREDWYHKRSQIYGTWNNYRAEKFKEIRNLNDIDKMRFEYNLLRLEEQSIAENRLIPEGYIKSAYPTNYFCGYMMKK